MSDDLTASSTEPVDYCMQHFAERLSPDVDICGNHLDSHHRCVFHPAYRRRDEITRQDIEHEVLVLIHSSNLPTWWKLYIHAMGMTAEEAFRVKPDELLEHVKGYSNTSFT